MKKYLILQFFITIAIFNLFSQQLNIDSLKQSIQKLTSDSDKISNYNRIGFYYRYINSDSALFYFDKSIDLAQKSDFPKFEVNAKINKGFIFLNKGNYKKAEKIFIDAKKISTNNDYAIGIAESIYHQGILNDYKGNYTEALKYYQKALETTISTKDSARYLIVIGNVHIRRAYYILALQSYQRSLKIMKKIRFKRGIATCYLNMGNVYLDQPNYKKALITYMKALVIYNNYNYDNSSIAVCYTNIGAALDNLNKREIAYKYYKKALKNYKFSKDQFGIGHIYANIAEYFVWKKNFDSAFYYFNKSEEIRLKLDDNEGLLRLYNNIGETYQIKGNYEKALEYSLKSLEMAKKIESLSRQREALKVISGSYAAKKDFKNAYKYQKQFKTLHDSIYNKDNRKKLTQQEVKYEYEKKMEIQKIEQKKKEELHKAEMKRQKNIRTAFIIGFMLLLISMFFIYRSYRIKKRANIKILQQNNEIEQKNAELEQQKEEIQTQAESLELANKEINTQKNYLEKAHNQVKDSIIYASKIQDAIITDEKYFADNFVEYFIFWNPRDVVSGDFYWLKTTEKNILIAVADCTGHGVPGAFMSVLGISLLNEIIRRKDLFKASETLEFLRKNIKISLKQDGNEKEQKDGMDMAFCVISKNRKTLQFAGANNPLFIIRDKKLIEYKPVRNPVGVYIKEKPYKNHTISLKKNDQIYMFSDGFVDQFSEKTKEKFKSKPFKELLVSISSKSMEDQKKLIEKTFYNWKGNHKQVDDVLVTGFKI